jgi:hypothetical protein
LTTHSRESALEVRNTQSLSPCGPLTKPSSETDIFNTSLRFVSVGVAMILPDFANGEYNRDANVDVGACS